MPLSKREAARKRQLANLTGRPPAPPAGNQRARRHGGYGAVATERLEAKAHEVFAAISEDAPLRAPDGGLPREDAVAVRLLAEVLCRLDSISAYLRDHGLVDGKTGQPRESLIALESRLRNEARDHAEGLGLTPGSRARLGLDLQRGFDLARHWQEEGDDDAEA